MSSFTESIQSPPTRRTVSENGRLAQQISDLGEWFHNLNLHGVPTAPHHFLGDFPNIKWKHIASAIPDDLSGDVDDRYLNQARFAAQTLGLEIELEKRSVYYAHELPGQFDYVLFMGVFYHLRYPLFALDSLIKKVKGKLIFQTMVRGSADAQEWADDYPFWNTQIFEERDFPKMFFIEKRYSQDPTNWWIPNCAAVEAMLRSSGLEIEAHPEPETWICSPSGVRRDGRYILDHELDGTL